MKIATFNTLESAALKLNIYNILATPTGYRTVCLTDIYKHTNMEMWWFNFDDCINNGGLGKTSISLDEANLTIEIFANNQALIDAGYLPQPKPIK